MFFRILAKVTNFNEKSFLSGVKRQKRGSKQSENKKTEQICSVLSAHETLFFAIH